MKKIILYLALTLMLAQLAYSAKNDPDLVPILPPDSMIDDNFRFDDMAVNDAGYVCVIADRDKIHGYDFNTKKVTRYDLKAPENTFPNAICLDNRGTLYVACLLPDNLRSIFYRIDTRTKKVDTIDLETDVFFLRIETLLKKNNSFYLFNARINDKYAPEKILRLTPSGKTTMKLQTNKKDNRYDFDFAYDITVDPSGNLYVSDSNGTEYDKNGKLIKKSTPRIRKFSPKGKYIKQRYLSIIFGKAAFPSVSSITSDSSGNIYALVSDISSQYIWIFNSSLKLKKKIDIRKLAKGKTHFIDTSHIAVDGKKNIYIADDYDNKVFKITPSGKISSWTVEQPNQPFKKIPGEP